MRAKREGRDDSFYDFSATFCAGFGAMTLFFQLVA